MEVVAKPASASFAAIRLVILLGAVSACRAGRRRSALGECRAIDRGVAAERARKRCKKYGGGRPVAGGWGREVAEAASVATQVAGSNATSAVLPTVNPARFHCGRNRMQS